MCEQLHNWAPMIVSIALEILVTLTMFMTATVDPGIIPANVSDKIKTMQHFDPTEPLAIERRYCNIVVKSQRVYFLDVSHISPYSASP